MVLKILKSYLIPRDKKPGKITYPKNEQRKIISRIRKMMKEYFSKDPSVVRIVLFGSLSKLKLGKYKEMYRGRYYPDIDVLVIVDGKIKKPQAFKFLSGRFPSCHLYVSKTKIKGKHPILVHVHDPKKHDRKNAIEFGMPIDWPLKDGILLYRRKKIRKMLTDNY